MAKSFQIYNNVIFSVNEDGSITQLAKINQSGDICNLHDEKLSIQQNNSGFLIVFLVLFIVLSVIFGCLFFDAKKKYNSAEYQRQQQYNNSKNQTSAFESERASWENEKASLVSEKKSAENALVEFKQLVGGTYPMVISEIEIANIYNNGTIETDYGQTIYSYNTMYLQPRIKYYGISSGDKKLRVKFYDSDGSLKTSNSSPYGFTYDSDCYIYSGPNNTATLSGWGNENKGHWKSGRYRVEIWYDNSCLKATSFYIH